MVYKIFDNEHGSMWYSDQIEPHVKNTLNCETRVLLEKIQEQDKRIVALETRNLDKTKFLNGFISIAAVVISLLSWIYK